ncbi:MAG: 4-hydroxy-tetrahydrodipicolinate reductase [Myxococcales bacterium]|nr:4-hydroxy-tetrahydrodipicolinate reductase [Myxococcales bacterium]
MSVDVVISGAAGRLGSHIVRCCLMDPRTEVVAALVRPQGKADGQKLLGSDGTDTLLQMTSDVKRALGPGGRVLIETALAPVALAHLAVAAEYKIPVCVATTGFSSAEQRTIEQYAQGIPILLAPNLSVGVTVLLDLVARAAHALDDYHLEVLELHHARKRDAPSGTAWALAQAASAARSRDIERDAVLARAGETGLRGDHEVGMQSIRGGDIFGEHTVYLVGEHERVELSHRSMSRDAFASGAVPAAKFLAAPSTAPGLYSMRDALGLEQ